MMLTPCWPSAGPTGGDGLAFPAGICSFTIAWTFFAMLRAFRPGSTRARPASAARRSGPSTFSLPRSGFMSSIDPLKLTKGPSITRTLSPFWKTDLGLGFSAPSSIWRRISSTSSRRQRRPAWCPSRRSRSPSASSARGARCRRSAPSRPARSPGRTSARVSRFCLLRISTTFSVGTTHPADRLVHGRRSWPATGCASATLFSNPEYVWTTYHCLLVVVAHAHRRIHRHDPRQADVHRRQEQRPGRRPRRSPPLVELVTSARLGQ